MTRAKPKKTITCPVCINGKVIDLKTRKERDCVMCLGTSDVGKKVNKNL